MKASTEILLSAAFVLTPKENWFGKGVGRTSGRRCAMMAIIDAGGANKTFDYLLKVIAPVSVVRFNDTHTHEQVLDALYKAAELAETE